MRRTTAYAVILAFLAGCGGGEASQELEPGSGPYLHAPGDASAAAMRVASGVTAVRASMFGLPFVDRLLAGATGGTTEEARSAGTIAGLLVGSIDDFTFTSDGGEMIFAVLDATVYQMAGRGKGHETGGETGGAPTALAAAPADCGKAGKTGGCSSRVLPRTGASPTSASGGESGGESGGCGGESGGGPPGMCMQVLDRSGQVICWADRAMAPGWMRDPKLACPLDLAGGYTLRIFRRGTGGNPCGPGAAYPAPNGAGRPYLLTVAKKKIPPVGSLSAALEIGGGSH
jgi:hypothetical protein